MLKKYKSLDTMLFKPWEGSYKKQNYDVMLQTGELILHCWPNANRMMSTNGTGRSWTKEDNISVRYSLTHPLDALSELKHAECKQRVI